MNSLNTVVPRAARAGRPEAATPGLEAAQALGWWHAHRFVLARRASQFVILALFLAGPWFGLWIVKGNLASSLTLGVLPLSDPFVLLQTFAAKHVPDRQALLGAGIVLAFYALVGGRSYCGWVCPANAVTDGAAFLRRRLRLKGGRVPPKETRYLLLAAVLLASFASGRMIWEAVNPVTMTQRGLIFGGSISLAVVAAVFLYDLLIAPRGWCGHLCPMGAFYSLLGRLSLLRVSAARRSACNDCLDCFAVCPEPQVIRPALKGDAASTPVILAGNCTNCGRCADVCSKDVFRFTIRFDHRSES